MSFDKNILKNLLKKLLESKLDRLEKRNTQQMKDLLFSKNSYKKQKETLNKIIATQKNLIKKNKNEYSNISSKFGSKERFESNRFKYSPKKNLPFNSRKALTPDRTKNNIIALKDKESGNLNKGVIQKKYNNIKSRYKDDPKMNKNSKKLFLTPEPKLRRKKKMIEKKGIEPKNLNLPNLNIKKGIVSTRNINIVKREEDHKKKTIVSDLGLEADLIESIIKEKRKDEMLKRKEDIDSNNDNDNEEENISSKVSNSSITSSCSNSGQNYIIKNKAIVDKFGKILISSDGDGNSFVSLISSFLDKKSKIYFLSISKKLIRKLTYYLDDLYKNMLKINNINSSNTIESQINNIKNKYGQDKTDSAKNAFSLSEGSVRALDLLNSEEYNNIFRKKKLEPPLDEIILIYRIFFQLIDKEELVDIENDKIFWEKTRNYILENNEGKTGTFFKEYISEFDFTNKNIYKLKMLIYGKEDKLKPLIYKSICKTTSLVIFIIKDSLEYCGLLQNDKKIEPYIIFKYLLFIQNNINRANEYIDKLKEF